MHQNVNVNFYVSFIEKQNQTGAKEFICQHILRLVDLDSVELCQ